MFLQRRQNASDRIGIAQSFFFLKYCVLYQILLAGNYSFWLPWKFRTIYAGLDTILSVKKYYQLIPVSWRTRCGKAFPYFCHVKTLPYVKTLKRKTTKVEDFSSAQIVLVRFYDNFLIPSKNSTFFLFVLNYLIAVKLLEY